MTSTLNTVSARVGKLSKFLVAYQNKYSNSTKI